MNRTMSDLASLAGVSRSTVSRVLNNVPLVSEDARAKVMRVVERLGYEPPRRGPQPRTTARTIGLITAEINNPTHSEMALAVEGVASASGYSVILCNTNDSPAKEADYVRLLLRRRVDGIVFISVRRESGPTLEHASAQRMPFVLCGRIFDGERYDTVCVDYGMGAFQATSHLLQLGHHDIGFIAGAKEVLCSAERHKGYRRALSQFGVEYRESLVVEGRYEQRGGYRAALQLLSSRARPTAIFAANDLMALGAMQAAYELGLRVPEDVAVVGFDDIPVARLYCVELTTVQHPMHELGALAAKILIERIEAGSAAPAARPHRVVLPPRLLIRNSCGAKIGGLGGADRLQTPPSRQSEVSA